MLTTRLSSAESGTNIVSLWMSSLTFIPFLFCINSLSLFGLLLVFFVFFVVFFSVVFCLGHVVFHADCAIPAVDLPHICHTCNAHGKLTYSYIKVEGAKVLCN